MALSDLTPSRQTCEALKAAGFPQTTTFVYSGPTVDPRDFAERYNDFLNRSETLNPLPICAAPTLSEVLDALPPLVEQYGDEYGLRSWPVRFIESIVHRMVGYSRAKDHTVFPFSVKPERLTPEGAARLYLSAHAAGLLRAEVPA